MPNREELWTKAKDILVIIVIPTAMWITSSIFELEQRATHASTTLEKSSSKIERLEVYAIETKNAEKEAERLSAELKALESKYDSLDNRGDSLEVKITRVESKMESMSSDIQEIKAMVQTLVRK
jgi:peptidoglycan hydrolase CwlO-like protein